MKHIFDDLGVVRLEMLVDVRSSSVVAFEEHLTYFTVITVLHEALKDVLASYGCPRAFVRI